MWRTVVSNVRTPMGGPKRRRVDNIRMDTQEVGMWVYGLDWAGPG